MANWFNSSTLFASLLWGSIGSGMFIYGWKQKSTIPIAGGLLLVCVSYFIDSGLYMTLAAAIIIAGMICWKSQID